MKRNKLTVLSIALVCVLAVTLGAAFPLPVANAAAEPTTLFVREYTEEVGTTSTALGYSWANAFTSLQDALNEAESLQSDSDDLQVEIWVAAGIYYPITQSQAESYSALGFWDRYAHFRMLNNVAIYGGFPANGGTWKQRNWETNTTILSGNIGDQGSSTDNSLHVIYNRGLDNTAILDGFTVSGGSAFGILGNSMYGGGIYNETSSPVIRNVRFTGNSAVRGGGMYNVDSSPVLSNVSFDENAAVNGGGMYNRNSHVTIANAKFNGNSAGIFTSQEPTNVAQSSAEKGAS